MSSEEMEQIDLADGTELEVFESAEVEEKEFIEHEQAKSIVESILFSTDRPQSIAAIKQAFKGTNIATKEIRKILNEMMIDYADATRGVVLEEVSGGYQLRTKVDNLEYLKRMVKGRSFKLSGPALEVLSIVAYKQPCIKSQIDEIRGVESGHLMRGLMERGLVHFAGKSELPGKPMLYQTTKKFLEIFGLRNLKELPSLSEIDELIPEGIGDENQDEETLDQVTENMSKDAGSTYSEGEEELMKIADEIEGIDTSSEFFEQEKQRMRDKRDLERAMNIKEALDVGEEISTRDRNWLARWEEKQELNSQEPEAPTVESTSNTDSEDIETDESIEVPEGKVLVEAHNDDAVSIGEVDFNKLEKDLEVFNEDNMEESQLEDEPEAN